MEQGAAAFEAASRRKRASGTTPILSRLLKAGMAEREVRSIAYLDRGDASDGMIQAQIEAEPSFGCRPVAWLPGLDKNTVRRIVRLKRRQVRKPPRRRAPAHRGDAVSGPGAEHAVIHRSVPHPDRQGWRGDARARHRLPPRALLGWHLSKSGKAWAPVAALEQALIARSGRLGLSRFRRVHASAARRHRCRTRRGPGGVLVPEMSENENRLTEMLGAHLAGRARCRYRRSRAGSTLYFRKGTGNPKKSASRTKFSPSTAHAPRVARVRRTGPMWKSPMTSRLDEK